MQKPTTKKPITIRTKLIKTALIWTVLMLTLDRGLKLISLLYWSQQPINLAGGWFLGHSINHYLAFSLPWSSQLMIIILFVLNLGLLIGAISSIKKQPLLIWGWSFLLAGSFSNIYDRIIYGGVIDYIASWWTFFNLADILILLGLFLIFKKHQNLNATLPF